MTFVNTYLCHASQQLCLRIKAFVIPFALLTTQVVKVVAVVLSSILRYLHLLLSFAGVFFSSLKSIFVQSASFLHDVLKQIEVSLPHVKS